MLHLARAFYIGAAMLGAIALMGWAVFAVFTLRTRVSRPGRSSALPMKNPDAILLIITSMARVIGAIAGGVGKAAQAVLGVVAVVSTAAMAMGAALFFTARGLEARQGWARGVGGLLIGAALLVSLALFLSVRGVRRILAGVLVAACAYGLRTVWVGFSI